MIIREEKNFKILIVDENIRFRDTLASRLRLQGFDVESATGGFHLLHILEKDEHSLLILHEDMPDMSAIEIISLIRTSKDKVNLPILFISEHNDEARICDMVLNGANEYIVKTDNFQSIVDRVKKYFTLLINS